MLQPQHIGEPLVAELLKRAGHRSALDGMAGGVLAGAARFDTHVPLVPLSRTDGTKLLMDGEHKLDLLAVFDTKAPMAIEVKLGESLRGQTFLSRYFVGPTLSSHSPPRLSGKVPGLLDVHHAGGQWSLPDVSPQPLRTPVGPLSLDWVLVGRRAVLESLPKEHLTCSLLSLEELVSAAGGSNELDSVVLELVAASAPFAVQWGLD